MSSKNPPDAEPVQSSVTGSRTGDKPAAFADRIVLWGAIVLMLIVVLPLLSYEVLRMTYPMSIDHNEGWNVHHTSRFLNGEPLYREFSDHVITPVNYPPLSFVMVGPLAYLTGSLLFTGRAVALVSLLIIGCLIFATIGRLTSDRGSALFGAITWLGLMVTTSDHYVGMYDPQLLGEVFSTAAFYLYCRWDGVFTTKRTTLLAFLCCLALFIKHLLIAVPLSLAVVLFLRDRRAFWNFTRAGMLIASAVLSAIWLYGGESLFANFLDLHRPASNAKLFRQVVSLFLRDSLAVVFLPFALVASKRRGKWMPILLYFCFSLLLGAYAVRGAGVDRNAWFSFFIAAALVSGLFASKAHTILSQWRPRALPVAGAMIVLALMMNEFFLGAFVSADGVLQDSSVWFLRITQGALLLGGMLLLNAGRWVPVSSTIGAGAITIVGLLPFLAGVDVAIREAFDYDKLRFEAKAYRADVKLLKTFPGPALFDDLLLGFDGGKELLFDVSNISKLMFSGRIPEGTLAARIREQHFNVIVTDFDVEERLAADRQKIRAGRAGARTAEWTRWPDSALHALREHYEALDRNGQRGRYVFYVPRGQNTNVAGVG